MLQYFAIEYWFECWFGQHDDPRTQPFKHGAKICPNGITGQANTMMVYELSRFAIKFCYFHKEHSQGKTCPNTFFLWWFTSQRKPVFWHILPRNYCKRFSYLFLYLLVKVAHVDLLFNAWRYIMHGDIKI